MEAHFMPPGSRRPGDARCAIDCVKRKYWKKRDSVLNYQEKTPTITIVMNTYILIYIQKKKKTTFLGINISKKELLNLRPSEEGTTIP